jgi:hypothetical protein
MDLTPASEARLWAAFQRTNHRYRKTKQIGFNEAIHEAYTASVGEGLSPESAVEVVVRWGRQLRWLAAHRQIRQSIPGQHGGTVLIVERIPVPDTEWHSVIAGLVADLTPVETATIVALLDRIVKEQGITQELWAKDHHIGWSTLKYWRAAGGKPAKGKVSQAQADKIETAIRQDAARLGL